MYVDKDILIKNVKVDFTILSFKPIFCSKIRLKKRRDFVYTYNTDRYFSNITEFCYGMLYEIDISEDNFEWLDCVMKSNDYTLDTINVSLIETNITDFIINKFKITKKGVDCLCYTTNKNERYTSIFRDRHCTVNFHKSLLINLLKE